MVEFFFVKGCLIGQFLRPLGHLIEGSQLPSGFFRAAQHIEQQGKKLYCEKQQQALPDKDQITARVDRALFSCFIFVKIAYPAQGAFKGKAAVPGGMFDGGFRFFGDVPFLRQLKAAGRTELKLPPACCFLKIAPAAEGHAGDQNIK